MLDIGMKVRERKTWAKKTLESHLDILSISLIFVIGLFLYIPQLGSYVPLRIYDEAIYGNVARHMVENGHWLIPHFDWPPGELVPFFEKPPLVMWLQALSMYLFGVTVFAVRLPIAIMAICLGILTYQIGTHFYDWRTGFAAALILFVMPTVYISGHGGRSGDLDVPLVLFGSLFVWFVLRARKNSVFLLLAGVAAAAAVLTKGFAAGTFLVILAPFLAVNWRSYLNSHSIFGALIAWGLILPWPIYAWANYPNEFIYQMIVRQTLRAGGEIGRSGGAILPFMNYPYFKLIFTYPRFAPFVLLSLIYVFWTIYRQGWSKATTELYLLWWVLAPPITFAIVGGTYFWYVLPMVVPLAILCGRFLAELVEIYDSVFSNQKWFIAITPARYLALGTLVVVMISVVAYPLLLTAFPTQVLEQEDHLSTQEEVGNAFSETPNDAVIYVEQGTFEPATYTFAFHANRLLAPLSSVQNLDDPEVHYAVVSPDTLAQTDRPYTIIKEKDDIVAIKLE